MPGGGAGNVFRKTTGALAPLVNLRYTKCLTVQEISRKSHGNPRTLYQQMGQIRHWLRDCIHGQMESGDA